MDMIDWNKNILWGNSLKEYAIAVGIVVVGIIILNILKYVVFKRIKKIAQKTETTVDDLILKMITKGILPLLYIIVLYIAFTSLNLNDFLTKALKIAMAVVTVFYVVRILIMGVDSLLTYYLKRKGKEQTKGAMSGIMIMVQIVLWVFGLVWLLGNLGYDIGSLLAGLGIGGIAIALAAQNFLGNVLAYFSVLFDRPYEVGEFLIIEDKLGTVTHIGIMTTRIQSLSGEELSYSNKNMLNQWIHNYSRMEKRRAVFGFNVSYDTPPDILERIPDEVKQIILAQNKVMLDRVHFAQFKDYYLYFEAVYYSMEPGYGEYMDKQQNINLAIMRKFEEMGVKFAFATNRSIYMQPNQKEGLLNRPEQ